MRSPECLSAWRPTASTTWTPTSGSTCSRPASTGTGRVARIPSWRTSPLPVSRQYARSRPRRKAEPMDDDPVSRELEEIRERGQRVQNNRGNVGGLLAVAEARNDIPRLLKALTALLDGHE